MELSPVHLLTQPLCAIANTRAVREVIFVTTVRLGLLADAFIITRHALIRNSLEAHNANSEKIMKFESLNGKVEPQEFQ